MVSKRSDVISITRVPTALRLRSGDTRGSAVVSQSFPRTPWNAKTRSGAKGWLRCRDSSLVLHRAGAVGPDVGRPVEGLQLDVGGVPAAPERLRDRQDGAGAGAGRALYQQVDDPYRAGQPHAGLSLVLGSGFRGRHGRFFQFDLRMLQLDRGTLQLNWRFPQLGWRL